MTVNNRLRRLLRRALTPGVSRIGTPEAVAYLQDVVAPRLGISPAGEFSRVRTGANTAVIRWQTPAGDVLFARFWPWKRKNGPVRQHLEAAALFRSAGVRTPETLFSEDSTGSVAQWGVEVIVERKARGEPLHHFKGDRIPALQALALDLVRLHACGGPEWNKPWLHDQGFKDPSASWQERLDRFRERVTPRSSGLTAGEIARSLELLQAGLADAARRKPVLVHGDVSQSHLFVDDDGVLTWIDLETVHFGAAEEDLAPLSRWLPPRVFQRFLRAYSEAGGGDLNGPALRTFCLLMQWERINSRVQQTRRRSGAASTGRKNLDKLAKDRIVAEEAVRGLISGEGPAFAPSDGAGESDGS